MLSPSKSDAADKEHICQKNKRGVDMRNSKIVDWFKNGDNQRTFKYHDSELNDVMAGLIETYIIYKEQLPGRGKSMKTLCGLLTVFRLQSANGGWRGRFRWRNGSPGCAAPAACFRGLRSA